MPETLADNATALIADILVRYHAPHRAALPELLAAAARVQAQCQADGLQADLRHWAAQLELHMFKEEMRLFPMMEQGGNTLIPRLIDDLQQEHDAHGHALQAMGQRLDAMPPAHQATPAWQALRGGLQVFEAALRAHIALEDDVLFPMFLRRAVGAANIAAMSPASRP